MTDPRRIRWLVPTLDARRASLRYRCLYPMRRLAARGIDTGIWSTRQEVDSRLVLVVDAWTLFPTICDAATSDHVVATARRVKAAGGRLVLDNCDNQFAAIAPTDDWSSGLSRLRMLSSEADLVVCCSSALREVMQRETTGSARHVVIDDPIEDVIAYPDDRWWKSLLSLARKRAWLQFIRFQRTLLADRRAGRTPMIWFGSHGNSMSPGGMLDLLPRRDTLENINQRFQISLSIVSNHERKFNEHFLGWSFPVRYFPWDRLTFIDVLGLHDVSLIPVVQNEFTKCKSSNRLTTSLHHGAMVVADPIESYRDFEPVVHLDDWESGLTRVLEDPVRTQRELVAAQKMARDRNNIETIAGQWAQELLG